MPHQLTSIPQHVGLEAAADRLGLSVHTLRRWQREGRLPVVRLGRRVVVSEETLAELLAQGTIGQEGK